MPTIFQRGRIKFKVHGRETAEASILADITENQALLLEKWKEYHG